MIKWLLGFWTCRHCETKHSLFSKRIRVKKFEGTVYYCTSCKI